MSAQYGQIFKSIILLGTQKLQIAKKNLKHPNELVLCLNLQSTSKFPFSPPSQVSQECCLQYIL